MKTKKLMLMSAIILSGNLLTAQTFEVDTELSRIEWHGKKIGTNHEGLIQLKSGKFTLENEQLVAGEFVVDMATITNSDIKNEGSKERLVGHLKSDDFFGVETFPTARFEVVQSSKFVDGKASLTGNITIKGKTEQITFDVLKAGKEYSADVEIDRSKFDVRFRSSSFFKDLGDIAIDDIFILKIKFFVI